MSYDIAFTQVFKDGVARLPKAAYSAIDRQINWLAMDPYAKNPNAKRLMNVRQTFRMRIGKDVRMLYRVDGRRQRVELFNIGERGDIYNGLESAGRVLTQSEADAVRAMLQDADAAQKTVVAEVKRSTPLPSAEEVEVEQLAWISADELFLLNVPVALWQDILATGTLEQLQQANLPDTVKLLIEDYWTNPSDTQVDKLYGLAPAHDMVAVAQQPLGHFLLALDPEQKDALRRLKSDGPYLLKGSAGTGKSLVGLYHMRDLITARAGTSLFDGTPSKFGVVTYTNTLVGANTALLRNITPNSAHHEVDCTTLDLVAYHLAQMQLGTKPNALSTEGLSKWLAGRVLPDMEPEVQALARIFHERRTGWVGGADGMGCLSI
jgi:mRNA interferase RelE/StbE